MDKKDHDGCSNKNDTLCIPQKHTIVNTYTLMPAFRMENDGHMLGITNQAQRKCRTNFRTTGYTTEQKEQLQYLQSLDLAMEEDAKQDKTWWAKYVSSHHVLPAKGEQPRCVIVWVYWQNDDSTWINADALHMQQPHLLVMYAARKGLDKFTGWKWTREYLEFDNVPSKVRKAFKVATEWAPKYKFGIKVPHSIWHALWLDAKNGNHMWEETINQELQQINAYETFWVTQMHKLINSYTWIPYHFVFNIKFDLWHKARLVADRNHTQPPKKDIFSGVVGMDTMWIGFLLAAMNDLQVCAANIGNAFLYRLTKEKVCIIARKEFGTDQGKMLIIDKGLYGLRSSSAHFHEHLSDKLRKMGYTPCQADPDFWIKCVGSHYMYIAAYVSDVLIFGKNPMAIIWELKCDYVLKGVGKPMYYLGGDMQDISEQWGGQGPKMAMSAETYICNIVKKFETILGPLHEFKSPMDQGVWEMRIFDIFFVQL